MYVPAHFAMTDEQITTVLAGLGQADLITQHDTGLQATPLPLLWDPDAGERGTLLGHVARNNTQWSLPSTGECLVIAHVTDHYVSPAWLPSRAEHAQVVPTWDYVTVHVYGRLVAHDDRDWTREVVRRLTEHHEARRVSGADRVSGAPDATTGSGAAGSGAAAAPRWRIEDAPADYVERMLRAIVGIEVRVTRVEAKAKMAQNKTPADVVALADALAAQSDRDGEAWVRQVSLPAAQRRAALLAEVATRHTPRS